MKHLFFDFETFGQNAMDCAIIDCSAFVADTDVMLSDKAYNLKTIEKIAYFKLSVKEQVDKYDWVVYKDTIDFWSEQSQEIKERVRPLKSDITVAQFVDHFTTFLRESGNIDYWWSRSNTFDPHILWRLYNAVNKYHLMNEYLKYWRVRDIRTFIDAKLDYPKENGFIPIANEKLWEENFKKHDSRWDVLADVLRMQAILRAENDLEHL